MSPSVTAACPCQPSPTPSPFHTSYLYPPCPVSRSQLPAPSSQLTPRRIPPAQAGSRLADHAARHVPPSSHVMTCQFSSVQTIGHHRPSRLSLGVLRVHILCILQPLPHAAAATLFLSPTRTLSTATSPSSDYPQPHPHSHRRHRQPEESLAAQMRCRFHFRNPGYLAGDGQVGTHRLLLSVRLSVSHE